MKLKALSAAARAGRTTAVDAGKAKAKPTTGAKAAGWKPGTTKVPPLHVTFNPSAPSPYDRTTVKLADIVKFEKTLETYPHGAAPFHPNAHVGDEYIVTLRDGRRIQTGILLAFDPKHPFDFDTYTQPFPSPKATEGLTGRDVQKLISKIINEGAEKPRRR